MELIIQRNLKPQLTIWWKTLKKISKDTKIYQTKNFTCQVLGSFSLFSCISILIFFIYNIS